MKKVLITGANSYIGNSFKRYIDNNFKEKYEITILDMHDNAWKTKSFSGFDAIYHVAGIVHQKETKRNAHLYYEVNRDLVIDVAKKAKCDGVKQFLFLSTMSVYGMVIGKITKETIPNPKTHYGLSKLQAEEALTKIAANSFKVVVLRPPMVYGNGCRGNYNAIIKLVKYFSVFPKVQNQRSMIYIDNLSAFVEMAIDKGLNGVFFPQDKEYSNTTNMAQAIAVTMNKKIYESYLLGIVMYALMPFSKKIRKAFGSLVYKDVEDFEFRYCHR